MAQKQVYFHVGDAYAKILVNGIAQIKRFGTLQDISLEFNTTTKRLMGQLKAPVDVATGGISISGKATVANIDQELYNLLFLAGTSKTGSCKIISSEAGTVTTNIVTVANSATWVEDLGVSFAATGIELKRVASAPAIGQYSVAAGVYTFNVGDNSKAVKISYEYTTTTGSTVTWANTEIGDQPVFELHMKQAGKGGDQRIRVMKRCILTKLSTASGLEEYVKDEMEFECFADDADQIMVEYVSK